MTQSGFRTLNFVEVYKREQNGKNTETVNPFQESEGLNWPWEREQD